jgi:hypothetical protein
MFLLLRLHFLCLQLLLLCIRLCVLLNCNNFLLYELLDSARFLLYLLLNHLLNVLLGCGHPELLLSLVKSSTIVPLHFINLFVECRQSLVLCLHGLLHFALKAVQVVSDLFDLFVRVSVAELFLSLVGNSADLSVDLILEALQLLLHKGGGMLRLLYGQLNSSVVALELSVDHDFELLDLLGLLPRHRSDAHPVWRRVSRRVRHILLCL